MTTCDTWNAPISDRGPRYEKWGFRWQSEGRKLVLGDLCSWIVEAPTAYVSRTTAEEFDTLVNQWESETMLSSSLATKTLHPAYLRIIALGSSAIPLVLERMVRGEGHWFKALEAMTGQNPAKDAETYDQGIDAWHLWGRHRGFVK